MRITISGATALIFCLWIAIFLMFSIKSMAATPSGNLGEMLYIRPYVFGDCLATNSHILKAQGIVIQNEAALKSQLANSPGCRTENTSQIDFTEFTLLGTEFFIPGGCSMGGNGFTVSVRRDDRHQIYTHTVVSGTGPCAGQSDHRYWVLVPKLPSGYRVVFERLTQPGLVISCGDQVL
uniref:Uncharacterized protein n=1 Tax=Cyanothece sp. (strain PCC 7425 / ATCC 29141) TaxID=395961 RepID=B8HKF0_CYAP4